jgi:toxin CptA
MSTRWSATLPTCRLEWRPSRLRAASLVCIGWLAAAALVLTALPPRGALALGVACIGWSTWRAWRDLREPPGLLVLPGDDSPVTWVDAGGTIELADLTVRWRGNLATVEGRDPAGKLRRLAWWPDTLPAPARRALRLAAGRHAPPRLPLPSH